MSVVLNYRFLFRKPERKDEVQRKTSRDKGPAPPPPPLQFQQQQSSIQPPSTAEKEKGPAPPPPVPLPVLPTPPSSPVTPPPTPPPPPVLPPAPFKEEEDSIDATPVSSFSEIRESINEKLFKEKKPPSPPPLPQEKEQENDKPISEGVTVRSAIVQEDNCNLIVVSNNQSDRTKANTSTITITSELPDPSNSLASNISQVSNIIIIIGSMF